MTPREVIADWEWAGDDPDSLDRADEIIERLRAAGLHIVSEGQAVVSGRVVSLVDVGMRVSAEQPDVARPMYEDEFSDYPTVPLFAAVPQVPESGE